MKPHSFAAALALCGSLLSQISSPAQVVLTSDTFLDPHNISYDGLDLVVSNCVLTVDGPHGFSSLRILDGGKLTHSPAKTGSLNFTISVPDEVQTLISTNPVALSNTSAVWDSIVVKDFTGIIVFTNWLDYELIESNGWTLLQRTGYSAIPDGATVLVDYDYYVNFASGLNLVITNDFKLDAGASIDVVGRGYGFEYWSGRGGSSGYPLSGGGGGHAGYGGLSSGSGPGGESVIGSAIFPISKGGAGGNGVGGPGANGGGAIRLKVGGLMEINGSVIANGANATNSRAGGGAGGSVCLTAQTLAGSGLVSAEGGNGEPTHGGGGGGGRIALICETNSFQGTIQNRGGLGFMAGGAGTTFITNTVAVGSGIFAQGNAVLLVDNGGRTGTNTPVFSAPCDLTVTNSAVVSMSRSQSFANILIASSGKLVAPQPLTLTTKRTTIEAGGKLSIDGAGYPAGLGNGRGQTYTSGTLIVAGGAGHGGDGMSGTNSIPLSGAAIPGEGGHAYDYFGSPSEPGSGGGGILVGGANTGGAGGGALKLIAEAIEVDGEITAGGGSATAPGGGGGSGGSVWIQTKVFAGSGIISANGGNGFGSAGGGAGGGRIAISCNTNSFVGSLTAYGGHGPGTNWGGAGTIFLLNPSTQRVSLVLDNGGNLGANTPLGGDGYGDLIIRNRAVGSPRGTFYCRSMLIASNSFLAIARDGYGVTVSGNLVIDSDAGIFAVGYPSNVGTGSGGTSGSTGASHGGSGGTGTNSSSYSPGYTYGLIVSPSMPGSRGAPATQTISVNSGGFPGGAIRLEVRDDLVVNGRISVNGLEGTGISGGGSGGSLWITARQILGTGRISADGGDGKNGGGGGGGGRIALYSQTALFEGIVSAYGGFGYQSGGAGTIYKKSGNEPGTIILDNGGRVGVTPLGVTSVGGQPSSSDSVIIQNGVVVSARSQMSFANLTVSSNTVFKTTSINISGSVLVEAGGAIDGDGAGSEGQGGGGEYGGGGGYGGYGGAATNGIGGGNSYGSISMPTHGGSRGSPGWTSTGPIGGSGGGSIRMIVGGPLTVNGRISVNGGEPFPGTPPVITPSGGGSGGSVWLTAGEFLGTGVISANGGNGANGGSGGGGGRIAVQTPKAAASFSGIFSARGGQGHRIGGAGTIFLQTNSLSGLVIIDNGGMAGTNTPLNLTSSEQLIIRNCGVGVFNNSGTIRSLTIASNSFLRTSWNVSPVLTVLGNAWVEEGGGIVMDGAGHPARSGQGSGFRSCGGGHGGMGGQGSDSSALGGFAYGYYAQPTYPGSGGDVSSSNGGIGGTGGGVLRMNVNGILQLNGRISVNGSDSSNFYYVNSQVGPQPVGGGAGGSIWLNVNQLLGTGAITANGGSGANTGGGGGGGRIAIYYMTNSFAGSISAMGGLGYQAGGAGTIFLKKNKFPFGTLLVDNGDRTGGTTPFSTTIPDELVVKGNGRVSGLSTVKSLLVQSNGWVLTPDVTVTGDARIAEGGGIISDGIGVSSTASARTGGSHGGLGGSTGGSAGQASDLIIYPTQTGSRGGNDSGSAGIPPFGGAGGGIVRMTVNGSLSVTGRISADGLNGPFNCGGGAGGSVSLNVNALEGPGLISAKGGTGENLGGGGGGGRISITYTTNRFAGTVTARGGNGSQPGGAGTIYLRSKSQPVGELFVNNGGLSGAFTPLSSSFNPPPQPFDLTIANGGLVVPSGSFPALSNLTVSAGGLLTSPSQGALNLAVINEANIEPEGAITATGRGHGKSTGPGAGKTAFGTGGGGGHGSIGGASASGALGGTNYGSFEQPIDLGSGGGAGSGPIYVGGDSAGGSAIRLKVGGVLRVDGELSANGNPGLQDNSGGGAGGSIWVTAGALTGEGDISADGGMGELFQGGGGAGGRVALYARTNSFTGSVRALGGFGASFGGDGTVLTETNTLAGFFVTSHTPSGTVSNAVYSVNLTFNEIIDSASVSNIDFTVLTPGGPLPVEQLSATVLNLKSIRLEFPSQYAAGDYSVEVGPSILDMFGNPMSQAYTGAFSIQLLTISGKVTDIEGQPVAGITVTPYGFPGAITDAGGSYSVLVENGWSGSVYPAAEGLVFAPAYRSYSNVTGPIGDQNFVAVNTIAPTVTGGLQGNNLLMSWFGLAGVSYQLYYSIDLVEWFPFGDPIPGSNAMIELPLTVDGEPGKFFRVKAN